MYFRIQVDKSQSRWAALLVVGQIWHLHHLTLFGTTAKLHIMATMYQCHSSVLLVWFAMIQSNRAKRASQEHPTMIRQPNTICNCPKKYLLAIACLACRAITQMYQDKQFASLASRAFLLHPNHRCVFLAIPVLSARAPAVCAFPVLRGSFNPMLAKASVIHVVFWDS